MNETFEQLTNMVYQAVYDSNPEAISIGFDAAIWVREWLLKPLPAMGGIVPITIFGTPQGRALVIKAMAQALEGTFA